MAQPKFQVPPATPAISSSSSSSHAPRDSILDAVAEQLRALGVRLNGAVLGRGT